MMSQSENPSNPWTTLEKKVIYDNPWIHVEEHQVINAAGNPGIYGVVSFKNYAIGIIPVDNEGNTWLIGQHRYPFDLYTWEIPEGGGSIKESPLENAKRELAEEAGLIADKWELIQEMQVSNSVTNEYAFIFLAQDLHPTPPNPDEDEALVIKKLHITEAYTMVDKGEILDSLTVVALLRARVLGIGM